MSGIQYSYMNYRVASGLIGVQLDFGDGEADTAVFRFLGKTTEAMNPFNIDQAVDKWINWGTADGAGHMDCRTLYGSFCDLVGDEGRQGIAFQTHSGCKLLLYGNAKCPLLTRLSQLGSAWLPWCQRMDVRSARAAVLWFTPFIPISPEAPFKDLEMAACGVVNQTLASAGLLMEKRASLEGQCMVIVGGPPPLWFTGSGIGSTTVPTFGRSQP